MLDKAPTGTMVVGFGCPCCHPVPRPGEFVSFGYVMNLVRTVGRTVN